MKKLGLFTIALLLAATSCNNEVKPTKTKTESKVVVSNDNTKFGIDASSNPQGLAVGSTAPDVVLNLADGSSQKLSDSYKKQPVVLFFYRGYWCPVCNKHLSTFARDAGKLEAKGVKLIAITPESYKM